MSDPVTNVEIEDVLSSIRRLVSDGDNARTRDPAQIVVAATEAARAAPDAAPESNDVSQKTDTSDRLVLTPAFLVAGGDDDRDARLHEIYDEEPVETQPEADDWQEEDCPEVVSDDADAEDDDGEDEDDDFRVVVVLELGQHEDESLGIVQVPGQAERTGRHAGPAHTVGQRHVRRHVMGLAVSTLETSNLIN